MTVSNIEPKNQAKEEHPASSSNAIATKKDFIKKKPHNKYNNNNNNNNNNRMRPNYSKYNSNNRDDYARYYPNQPLKSEYPMPYVYYYPPPSSMYYPPLDAASGAAATSSAIIPVTRDEDDLEIIVHDESMNNVSSVDTRRSSSSDQNKPIDLKKQLEFYFSRQNLVNDTFLVSQMDADLYVPISLVANFRRVREWTTDMDLIVQTLRDSSAVTVDESGTRVKPNISVQRNTVILRDVPECTQQEINDLLKDLDSPPVQSIKQDIGNMWYFTFESEDDALKLLLGVRGKSFKGQAIAARMKSEPVLRVQGRATGAAAASAPSFTHQNIKAEGRDLSATTTTTVSHESPVALPELPPVYYAGASMNGSNFYYPSYASYNNNKRNNYGHTPFQYNNSHQPHPKYNNTYQQPHPHQHQHQHPHHQQQQRYHYQQPASVPNRHEGNRSFIDNQKNTQVGGRSARGGYNTNKPRYFRNGPEADSNVVENGLNKLTMDDNVPHPPPSQPYKQAQYHTQQQRQPYTTYQNNKYQYHTRSGNNSKFTNNNNSSNYQSQQQQPNVPYTKPNYTSPDAAAAAPSSSTVNTNAATPIASTTQKNNNRNSNPQSNAPQKQQHPHPPSAQQQQQPQQQQQQQQNKKKGRHSNSQQPQDNNPNTHHAGGGKIDNKKKKGNNKATAAQEPKENTKQVKQEGKKVVDLKPTHFPPLPNQQPPTAIAAVEQPTPPARSVADIVKSTVAPKPKKQMPVEQPKKEQQPAPSPPSPPAAAAAAVATPTLATTTDQKTANTFSYADMLKKNDL